MTDLETRERGGDGRRRRSPFAPDVLPDGRRRFSHRAVVARRGLLVGLLGAGVGGGVLVSRLGSDTADAGTDAAASPPPAAPGGTPDPATTAVEGPSTSQAASPWVVVNKQHALDPLDYAPALATVGGREVAAVIAADLQSLLDAAAGDGVSLSVTSGYRSFSRQQTVHDNAVARDGLETAESVSARPGFSEHQTGLAVDFGGSSTPGCLLENCFGQTPESQWLQANGGRFGFLLRYPEGRTDITGYDPEPWHWRWVGSDLVDAMAQRGVLTMEEHFGISGGTAYA